ncbi:MAG: hypothetical protein EA357_00365 [Micavibrio sp.]|nr:MAG: hypothetical protein EA357_00365 [Micavibrio sp.]
MFQDKTRHTKENRLFGYVIINAEGDILDGIGENGKLHFTPQYLLAETGTEPLLFKNRMRLPREITERLDRSHGLMEVRLDKEGNADADAVLNGRVIGSVSSVLQAAHMSKIFEDSNYATRDEYRMGGNPHKK